MVRRFIRDAGRFKKGDVRDYPRATWNDIAKASKRALNGITEPIDTFNNAERSKEGR